MESHDLKLIRKKRREQTNTQSTAKDETKNIPASFFISLKTKKHSSEINVYSSLSFHHCDGKLMTSKSLMQHLESIKSCIYHLGVLHVLKHLYNRKKRCIHTTQIEDYKKLRLA